MPKTFRRYKITIEEAKDEQINLQRFLLKSYCLAIKCFPSLSSNIRNGVLAEHPLNVIVPLSTPELIEP